MMKWLLPVVLMVTLLLPGCVSLTPSIVTFEVTPVTITAGQSATLVWDVSGASSVSIDHLGQVAPSGAQTVMPATTTVYTLTASNVVGTITRSTVIIVNPQPVAIVFEVNPATMVSGGSATLLWNVTGAASVSIDQGIGQVPPVGNRLVSPTVTTTYTLTAGSGRGTDVRSVTIVVNPTINATLTASPSTISPGQATSLQWNVTGATSVSIEPEVGDVEASGSRTLYPYTTTTYTLSAASECCAVSKSAVVTVGRVYSYPDFYPYPYPYPYPPDGNQYYAPFVEIFTVSPAKIQAGKSATLSWYVVGATSVHISGIGYVSYSGSVAVSPAATTTYTLTARNAYALRTRRVRLAVEP